MPDRSLMALSAAPADLGLLARLMAKHELPVEDLTEPGRVFFEFYRPGGTPVGVGGLEIYGAHALLRSVVTLDAARGTGAGRAIVEWLAEHAAQTGVETLYLLTFSAPGFFERCGFAIIPREAVSPEIAATAEFSLLCRRRRFA